MATTQLPEVARDLLRSPGRTLRSLGWRALHPAERLIEPTFIVGAPRSGTTLAVDLFATHPDVANWSEAGRIFDPLHYHDPDAEHAWTEADATPARIQRLRRWLAWYRHAQGKPRFVNKHPRNSLRIPYLLCAFPDARFIHVIRDGRAVVSSMLEEIRRSKARQRLPMGRFAKPAGWRALLRDDLAEQSALQWQAIVRSVRAHRERLGSAYCEVRYEALCQHPRDTYRAVFAFAGLSSGSAALAGIPERLEASSGWRERLGPEALAAIQRAAGGLLEELGYAD